MHEDLLGPRRYEVLERCVDRFGVAVGALEARRPEQTAHHFGLGPARHDGQHGGTVPFHTAKRMRLPFANRGDAQTMKKLLEILVCFLHPLAVVLAWINLLGRNDLNGLQKLAWAVFMIVPVVPFVYVLTGGELW